MLISRMRNFILRGLWIGSYAATIWLFRLMQKTEHRKIEIPPTP
jgi:hypothetical protein